MTFSAIDSETRERPGEEFQQLLLQMGYVLDSIDEGVLISDLEGNVLAMNQVALTLHEFDHDQQVCRHLSSYREIFDLTDFAGEPVPLEKWPFTRVYLGEHHQRAQPGRRHGIQDGVRSPAVKLRNTRWCGGLNTSQALS